MSANPVGAVGGFVHTVTDGSLIAAAGVAVLVGVIGFLSPCVLPLVPGYLSYVAGLSGEGGAGPAASSTGAAGGRGRVATKPRQRRMIAGALLFVLGFTAVFVTQGFLFGALGGAVQQHHRVLEQVFGAVTVVLGIGFLGYVPALQREFKVHRLPRVGLAGAPLLGIVFALAWTPCQTPTLGTVDTLASVQGSAARGAFLQVCYCVGLGIPFVLVALGFGWVTNALAFVRRHRRVVSQAGGALLIVIGVLLVTGAWDHLMAQLSVQGADTGLGSDL